ncbi:MAG: dTDP-4-dehydrorhamnose 3,5-epimerase [[Candidatus Thermochlorobacteriaceae] bacterium GBChlB]|nr:MAG: dTDP-4-dehydrorhamnose 3,5-epimerase [[Candidatus Thermochlorobacteriaceae] bacterium GBChlB]
MTATPTPLRGLLLLDPKVFSDERGFFYESYNIHVFQKLGIEAAFVQDNVSRSVKGVLRGLHYQIEPAAQGKLVRVAYGEVLDVCVDIRIGSPTFGKWHSEVLSAQNKKMLWIPAGFAHGFLTLSDEAEFTYKVTHVYSPQHDRCLVYNDADVGIVWHDIGVPFLLSEKDKNGKRLRELETNFTYAP